MSFNEYRCENCGGIVSPTTINCPHCGVRLIGIKNISKGSSSRGFYDNRSFKQKFIDFSKGIFKAILSLLVPGLGQILNKHYKKALFLFSVPLILWSVAYFFYPTNPFEGVTTKFYFASLVALIIRVSASIDAGKLTIFVDDKDLSFDSLLWILIYALFLSIMILECIGVSYIWIILLFPLLSIIFIFGLQFLWDDIKYKFK